MKHISKNKQQYFKYYTILFIMAVILVFSWYFLTGTSFIWENDGWMQHYKALVYYSGYLRQVIHGIFSGQGLKIPLWDFNIGEGSDILAVLHYYVIGDPFTVFSVFVPESFMYIYYAGIIILKMYLAGIAFSYLCFKTGRTSSYAVMAGCFVYVFCYWAVINVVRHPFFLNPMIYLPLLIAGIEKILKKERPYLFIITVFLSAVSNFYFFYILVLLTVIYVIIRFCNLYRKDWNQWISALWRITAPAVTGVLMSAVILLPVCFVFLNDTRMSSENILKFAYPLSYYGELPVFFIAGNSKYWLCMGYASPVLAAIFLMFYKRRKYSLLKTFLITGTIIILVPFFGQVLNGFSYMANRWSFAFSLICAYSMVLMWPHLVSLKLKEARILFICIAFYFVICFSVCMITGRAKKNVCVSILLAYIFIIILMPAAEGLKNRFKINSRKNKQKAAIAIIIINIVCNSYFSNITSGYINECKKIDEIQELRQNETQLILEASQNDNTGPFFRYSGKGLSENANMISGISSSQYFWSLSNPYAADFRRKLELREPSAYHYNGYDDRTALMALASVLYYVNPAVKKPSMPYGYKKLKDISNNGYKIYKNKYSLPYGYTYKNFIPEEKWEKLSVIDKQDALLQGAVIGNYNGKTNEISVKPLSQKIDYKITCKKNNVVIKDNSFVVKENEAKIKFIFKGLKESETYFSIKGLNMQNSLYEAKIGIKASGRNGKKLNFHTKEARNYNNRHDFIVNLGYSKKPVKCITVTFPYAATYYFNDINIICENMENYKDNISLLKEDTIENLKMETNCITGNITLTQTKILCLPVPYSVGWEAFVDGKKADLYKVNIMYMALELDGGSHNIVLKYHTPFLKTGVCVSLISALLFGIWVIVSELNIKKYFVQRDIGNG